MKGKWKVQGRALTVIAGTCAAVAVAGGAYAAIPSSWQSGSVITSCYDATGAVKVIDKEAGAACPAGTTQLQWNQQGRTGPTGPRGAQGAPGPAYFIRSGKYAEASGRRRPGQPTSATTQAREPAGSSSSA